MLTSEEWVLIKPVGITTYFVGDLLYIEEQTDIDSLAISWGDTVKYYQKL